MKPDPHEKQLFDMNCNDCKFMTRSIVRRQEHVDFHYKMQKDLFDQKRKKILIAGEKRIAKGEKDKAKLLFKQARSMKFVFSEDSCTLSYGRCTRKKKDISFIPQVVMEENYQCFEHRSNLKK